MSGISYYCCHSIYQPEQSQGCQCAARPHISYIPRDCHSIETGHNLQHFLLSFPQARLSETSLGDCIITKLSEYNLQMGLELVYVYLPIF